MKTLNIHLILLISLTMLACSLWGCSPNSILDCPEPGEKIKEPGPDEEYVSLTIQNDFCMSVCQVFVSPDHCEYMGGVDLVQDHPLRSGESIRQDVPRGKYAVWFELCTEEFRADERIDVRSDHTHALIDDPGRGGKPPCGTSITIINNSDDPICRLWISNSESTYDSWNWVGVEHIQSGESLNLALRTGETYSIRAEDCDGNRLRYEGGLTLSGHQDWIVP
jgi:hypothetical protein